MYHNYFGYGSNKNIINLIEVDGCIGKMKIGELLEQTTFIYVPLVNPDGVDLVLNGLSSVSEIYKNKPYLDEKKFSNWKSNINGVDLNKNYPNEVSSYRCSNRERS